MQTRLRLVTSNGQRGPGWRLTPDRRLVLASSHGLPPDARDREWEGAGQAYPHLRHWVVQIKQAVRERELQAPPQPQ
jgi:hypothetical protein